MSEEEIIEKLSNYLKDSLGKDLIKALKTALDKQQKEIEFQKEQRKLWRSYYYEEQEKTFALQKENEDMREELQMYVDTPINKLIVENEELKEQRDNAIKLRNELIEEQKITCISKNKIRDKIKELEEVKQKEEKENKDEFEINSNTWAIADWGIDVLKELLGE